MIARAAKSARRDLLVVVIVFGVRVNLHSFSEAEILDEWKEMSAKMDAVNLVS